MVRFFAITFFLFAQIYGIGQMFVMNPAEYDFVPLCFNSNFAKNNAFEKVTIVSSVKKDNQPIEKTTERMEIFFDMNGLVTNEHQYDVLFGKQDTSEIKRVYAEGCLIEKKTIKSNRISRETFEYDEHNRMVAQTLYASSEDEKESEIWIRTESYSYKNYGDSLLHKYTHNSEGKKYLQETWVYNDLGYLTEFRRKFIVTRATRSVEFTYDQLGRMASKEFDAPRGKGRLKTLFEYDDLGNFESAKQYNDTELLSRIEVVYKTNGIPEAVLTRKMDSSEIVIMRIECDRFAN